jgi:predicted ferric reductase
LFVPGASSWEPLAVAFGVMAFYAMVVVSCSFYVKKWIGQSMWRSIHYLAFGTFVAAAAHGIVAGTDTQHPVVLSLYVATVAIVVLLLVVRVSQEAAALSTAEHGRPQPKRTTAKPPEPRNETESGNEMANRLAALQARRVERTG